MYLMMTTTLVRFLLPALCFWLLRVLGARVVAGPPGSSSARNRHGRRSNLVAFLWHGSAAPVVIVAEVVRCHCCCSSLVCGASRTSVDLTAAFAFSNVREGYLGTRTSRCRYERLGED